MRIEILKNEKAEYGKLVITTLSKNLSHRYGNVYSRAALFRMIQFYDDFSDEETIANEIRELREEDKMSVDMFYRDPYMLDFLELKDTFSEKDLESAILAELEKFILEMRSDFAFMARQKRIVIDNKDYKIDLLFFHRSLKRLVIIELKILL